jgi:hypothetical protein
VRADPPPDPQPTNSPARSVISPLPPLGDHVVSRLIANGMSVIVPVGHQRTRVSGVIVYEPRLIRTRPRMVVMVISGERGQTGAPRTAQALSMRCRAIAGTDPVGRSFPRSRGAVHGRAFKGDHARPPPCVESVHGAFPPYLSAGPTMSWKATVLKIGRQFDWKQHQAAGRGSRLSS